MHDGHSINESNSFLKCNSWFQNIFLNVNSEELGIGLSQIGI